MKIQSSIRSIYESQYSIYTILQTKVDSILRSSIHTYWHYESRLKSVESFALKVETGRYPDPKELEDFFGCLIVVRNASELTEAEDLIKKEFEVKNRRPENPVILTKPPEDFRYDGTRLYVKLKENTATKPTPLEKVTFEIQIKTYLMHAWDISTHDIVYKALTPNWGTSRVAYQIRAMLEHADISIMEAENLAKNSTMNVTTKEFQKLFKIVEFLKRTWDKNELPSDLRRLSENVSFLIDSFCISIDDLESIIEVQTKDGKGTNIKNLSPYSIILSSILAKEPAKFSLALQQNRKRKLLITPELNYDKKPSDNGIFI